MTTTFEREVKLRFDSVEVARKAVLDAGASPLLGRRLQEDSLLDTTMSRCAGVDACCACASRTARAGSRSRARFSHRS